jgi:hypothetical protein
MKWFKYWHKDNVSQMYQVGDTVQEYYKEFLDDTPEEAWRRICGVTSNGHLRLVAVDQDNKVYANVPSLKEAIRSHKVSKL